ncbi:hypothetical protein Misp06_01884 [Microbulbifer sp. NBRC 101763]|uniref:hypothetical protein n=2 Tax=Microbulbifer TaxID=48073 RepID=UPI0030A4C5D7
MRGVMYAALILAAHSLATPAGAVSACETEKTQKANSATAVFPHTQGHELMLEQATREQEKALLKRQMRQLEKLREQAEREAVRAEKLQQLKSDTTNAG